MIHLQRKNFLIPVFNIILPKENKNPSYAYDSYAEKSLPRSLDKNTGIYPDCDPEFFHYGDHNWVLNVEIHDIKMGQLRRYVQVRIPHKILKNIKEAIFGEFYKVRVYNTNAITNH